MRGDAFCADSQVGLNGGVIDQRVLRSARVVARSTERSQQTTRVGIERLEPEPDNRCSCSVPVQRSCDVF